METHDGASYQAQAQMQYNGLGQRLALTAHQGGQSLTTSYLLDGDTLLAATASGQTTYYLSGIGEYQAAWSYYLADGMNSVRQITNAQGVVMLTRSFTPWGELLALSGTGDFTWGYLGEVLDAATGLVYVGNGQYYDPATGRFLSRGVNLGAPNPYVPWQVNPTGMIVGPLALLALIRGKRKAGKFDRFMVVAIVVFAMSLTVAGCAGYDERDTTPQPPSTPISTPTEDRKPNRSDSGEKSTPTPLPTRNPIPTRTCPPTRTSAPTPTPAPTPLGGDQWNNVAQWLKTELETRDGWWNAYKYQGSFWRLMFALTFDWELGPYDDNKRDQELRDGYSEAMARKAWSFSALYGGNDIGFSIFIVSRDGVIKRFLNVNYGGLTFESQILETEYFKRAYDKEANDFYTNRDWRKMDGDRPWDWGNPTSSSPQTLLSHLRQGVLKGDGKGDIWYLKGNLSVAIKQYQEKY